LIVRMLAKRPESRVQQMADVVRELEALARTVQPAAPPKMAGAAPREARNDSTVSLTRAPDQTIAFSTGPTPGEILVVEPSRSQASIIKMYLQEQSLSAVGFATSASEAIEGVRKLRPSVVVSAMHLSDASGIALAEQIQAEFGSESPSFILVTSESEEAQSLSKLSRVRVLSKPFTAIQLAEAVKLATGTGSPGAGPVDRSQKRVLVVDDSSTARTHMRSVLAGLGFSQFTEVADGAHAIAVAVRETFDLVVTDYNMPLMDGRALVSYFKQNPTTASLPIVMVTTETDPAKLNAVRQLGVVAILDKSFSPTVVGPLLDELF
jgi:two-component system, chemotaxis family, chemotaxis protein CheY